MKHVIWIIIIAGLFSGCGSSKPAPLPRADNVIVVGPVSCFSGDDLFHCTGPKGIWLMAGNPLTPAPVEVFDHPAPKAWILVEWTNGRTGVAFYVRNVSGRVEFSLYPN
jgi:hypothetical protein